MQRNILKQDLIQDIADLRGLIVSKYEQYPDILKNQARGILLNLQDNLEEYFSN